MSNAVSTAHTDSSIEIVPKNIYIIGIISGRVKYASLSKIACTVLAAFLIGLLSLSSSSSKAESSLKLMLNGLSVRSLAGFPAAAGFLCGNFASN